MFILEVKQEFNVGRTEIALYEIPVSTFMFEVIIIVSLLYHYCIMYSELYLYLLLIC